MIRHLLQASAHRVGTALLDDFAFGLFNGLQLRARGGRHSRAALEAYLDHWRGAGVHDYFVLPPRARLPLPRHGGLDAPTPHTTGEAANDVLHLDLWPGPRGRRSPAMVMLHGIMSLSDTGYRRWAATLNELGWTAAFYHLPYHYSRRPAGTVSGEVAMSANLMRTMEAVRQAVIELRLIATTLRQAGAPEVGLWGTSYGGMAAALAAVVEPAVTTAWLIEPIVDVGWCLRHSPANRVVRAQLRRRGLALESLTEHLRLMCPSHHQPAVPAERVLLLAGDYDRIAPAATIAAVHARWSGSHFATCPQGHIGYQLMPESLAMARRLWPGLFASG